MADLKDDEMLLAVKVPSNGTPGMVLNVSSPDGRVFEVVVPPNTPPGSTINVLVKKPPLTPEEAGLPVAVSVPAASGGMEAAAPTVKESGDAGDAPEGAARGPREKVDSRSTAAAAGAAGAGVCHCGCTRIISNSCISKINHLPAARMPRTVHIVSLPGVSLHAADGATAATERKRQQQSGSPSSSCREEEEAAAGDEGGPKGLERQLLPVPVQGGDEVRSSTTTAARTTCRSSDELVHLPVRRLLVEEEGGCGGGGDFSVAGDGATDSAVFLNGKRVLKLDRTLVECGLPRGVAVAVRSFESGGATTGRLLGGAQTLEQWLEGKYGAVDPTTVTEITGAPEDLTGEWWCRSSNKRANKGRR